MQVINYFLHCLFNVKDRMPFNSTIPSVLYFLWACFKGYILAQLYALLICWIILFNFIFLMDHSDFSSWISCKTFVWKTYVKSSQMAVKLDYNIYNSFMFELVNMYSNNNFSLWMSGVPHLHQDSLLFWSLLILMSKVTK